MKLTVKTLKGNHFEILVQPGDTIIAVKKNIEEVQGKDSYPWGQQLLIHNGKVLKDESTLEENNVSEDGFLVVMLSKSKTAGTCGSSSAQTSTTAPTPRPTPTEAPTAPTPRPTPTEAPTAPTPHPTPTEAPPPTSAAVSSPTTLERTSTDVSAYGQAASNLVAASNLEQVVQQLLDMGGGNWDRETVLRALRAAYNNPERAVEYLYSGIPASAETVPVDHVASNQASDWAANASETAVRATPASGLPNSSPLNMFPQEAPGLGAGVGGGTLEFLRNNEQFQTLRSMVQANPQILQPMLQELSKQNPELLRLLQEHQAEFLQLINEPPEEGDEGDLFDDQPDQETITVTPAEQEAIGRLEAMGFDRARVIEAFFACDRNEELAANYLLEHAGDDD